MNPTVKGYKVFTPEFKSKEGGMQFHENGTFEVSLPIKICNWGLHFCINAAHCFTYYGFDPANIVCEVEALGEVKTHDEDSKVCTNILKVGRRLKWEEVLVLANTGKNNAGHSNSGDRNSGDSNSGYRNSGDSNSGNWNSGNWNSGDRNSGDSNSGYRNSGDSNSGYSNSGNWNSGNWNSGNWNSGDRNSGDSNSGYRSGGAFCADPNPKLILFDKPCDITVKEWEESKAVDIMSRLLENTMWIDSANMTEQEKEKYPSHKTTGGYLKTKTLKEAWADMWGNLHDSEKKVFTSLPNFNVEKFYNITGIDLS